MPGRACPSAPFCLTALSAHRTPPPHPHRPSTCVAAPPKRPQRRRPTADPPHTPRPHRRAKVPAPTTRALPPPPLEGTASSGMSWTHSWRWRPPRCPGAWRRAWGRPPATCCWPSVSGEQCGGGGGVSCAGVYCRRGAGSRAASYLLLAMCISGRRGSGVGASCAGMSCRCGAGGKGQRYLLLAMCIRWVAHERVCKGCALNRPLPTCPLTSCIKREGRAGGYAEVGVQQAAGLLHTQRQPHHRRACQTLNPSQLPSPPTPPPHPPT